MRITNPRLIYAGLQIQHDVGVEVITLLVCYAGFVIMSGRKKLITPLLCRICKEINYPFVMPDLQSGVIELRICNPQHPLIIHRN